MAGYIPGELTDQGQGYEHWYYGRRKSQDDYNSKFAPELERELDAPTEEDEEEDENE